MRAIIIVINHPNGLLWTKDGCDYEYMPLEAIMLICIQDAVVLSSNPQAVILALLKHTCVGYIPVQQVRSVGTQLGIRELISELANWGQTEINEREDNYQPANCSQQTQL